MRWRVKGSSACSFNSLTRKLYPVAPRPGRSSISSPRENQIQAQNFYIKLGLFCFQEQIYCRPGKTKQAKMWAYSLDLPFPWRFELQFLISQIQTVISATLPLGTNTDTKRNKEGGGGSEPVSLVLTQCLFVLYLNRAVNSYAVRWLIIKTC